MGWQRGSARCQVGCPVSIAGGPHDVPSTSCPPSQAARPSISEGALEPKRIRGVVPCPSVHCHLEGSRRDAARHATGESRAPNHHLPVSQPGCLPPAVAPGTVDEDGRSCSRIASHRSASVHTEARLSAAPHHICVPMDSVPGSIRACACACAATDVIHGCNAGRGGAFRGQRVGR